MYKNLILCLTFIISLSSCLQKVENNPKTTNNNPSNMSDLVVPASFNYETTRPVEITINTLANNDDVLSGVPIEVYSAPIENGGFELGRGFTDTQGKFISTIEIPTDVKEVYVITKYVGLVSDILMPISGNKAALQIGGKNPQMIKTYLKDGKQTNQISFGKAFSRISYRLGSYTSGINGGVPNYLSLPNDQLNGQFLANVNASLPEQRPVTVYHSQYLASGLQRDLKFTALCDVWITFVSGITGNRNSLLFYKYKTSNPPTSVAAIDSLIAVFPNARFLNNGGGLSSGNKVYLGRVGADSSIGFAIAVNGWNNGTNINPNTTYFYSNRNFNPESTSSNKEHLAFLYDQNSQRIIMGFEDTNRDGRADNDFNDCVFYTSSNPVSSIDLTNVLESEKATGADKDKDGVLDAYDEYPNDINKAFTVFYPSSNSFATVAFEDNWPSTGDYDINDVVIAYQYKATANATNKLVDLSGKFTLRAAGGVNKNGFSVEIPLNKSEVSSITGLALEENANKAIISVFANTKAKIPNYNTFKGTAYNSTDTVSFNATFNGAKSITLGAFNPFIFVNEPGKGRGYEVHLPNMSPTELANLSVLGTKSDNSIPSSGRYYKTTGNLPFALNFPDRFNYPSEKSPIISAYTYFAQWAQSGGTAYPDWYSNKSGYRNNNFIY